MKHILIAFIFFISFGLKAQNEISIWVDGSCETCQGRIEKAALQISGVNTATWNLESQLLTVDVSDDFDKENLLIHLSEVGYDTKSYKASHQTVENYNFCCSYIDRKKNEANLKDKSIGTFVQKEIWVNGVCGMCQDRIQETSLKFKDISQAQWDLTSKILVVDVHEDFDIIELHKALAEIGHDTKLEISDEEVYNDLHGCCKYRDEDVINAHTSESILEGFKNWDANEDASNTVHGVVHELTKEGAKLPIVGASINWLGTTKGAVTDDQGFFSLDRIDKTNKLVINYVGIQADTIEMSDQYVVDILIKSNFILDEISISHKKKTTEISFLNTKKIRQIDQKELLKAACCSLSESFETTPSVDVSFTDAVTGTRKIELLGLAGPNVQIMRENIPYVKGLAALNGLELIPGPWVESMQLNIGSGSVINGPEALTGQINVEIKKPRESERAYIGLYGNILGRYELNANTTQNINDQLSTALIIHGSTRRGINDRNSDEFLDTPLGNQFYIHNRWKYQTKNNLQSQFGIKYSRIDKTSGQHSDLVESTTPSEILWTANQNTGRLESWFKLGKVFDNDPNKSIGFIANYTHHSQISSFGYTRYSGTQGSLYSNLIFSQLVNGTTNKINYGLSLQVDNFNEEIGFTRYLRNEILPGIFAEYNTSAGDKWDFVFGLRGDYHNNFGLLINPRVHAKYAPSEFQAWRFSAGRGIRTASIFAENPGIFVSSRVINILGEGDTPYGLGQEIAWNAGLSYTQEVIINERSLVFGGEYFYTFFENNVLIDFVSDVNSVSIYNAENGTTSHSVQLHAEYEILKNFSLKAAYRFNDVRSDFISGRQLKPLISRHRAFLNASVELPKRWSIDGTLNVQGRKLIPDTSKNPIEFQLEEYSPTFFTINGQVSKFFKKGFETYLGVENLLDFRQEDAIVDAQNPFGPNFDSSLIWGPVMGRNVYIGVRYRLY